MPDDKLPQIIAPLALAKQGVDLSGKLPLAIMSRLAENQITVAGEVHITLQFTNDEQACPVINGQFATDLALQCQRCMQTMQYPVASQFVVSPVYTDVQAEALPETYEPVMIEEDSLDLVTLIEDELLLQLPIVAMHEPAQCPIKLEPSASNTQKPNPFAVLSQLKKEESPYGSTKKSKDPF